MKLKTLTLFIAMVVLASTALEALTSTQPNVLLIYVDDMGYNDLACYGAKDPGIKTRLWY